MNEQLEQFHRCERWERRRLLCPFRHTEEVEPEPRKDVRFRKTGRAVSLAKVGRPVRPKRAPKELEAEAGVPVPVRVPTLPNLIGEPLAEEIEIVAREEPGFETTRERPWVPTKEDLAILERIGIPRGQLVPFRVAKGVPRPIREAMAEEAMAAGLESAEGGFPLTVFMLPLVLEALRRLASGIRGAPGIVADPKQFRPFRTSTPGELRSRPAVKPNTPASISRMEPGLKYPIGKPAKPAVRQGGYGVRHVQADRIMQGMTDRVRRRLGKPKPVTARDFPEQERV